VFTQSMPQLAQALSGALPEAALRQLMQALGNCQQPLSHRGAVNLQPPTSTGPGGLARKGVWKTSDYPGLIPTAGQDTFVDVAGDTYTNTTNTNNYDGHQFNFPINQDFNYNNYFGGDTFNVAGNSTFDNTYINNTTTQNLNTTNLNVEYINNTYVGSQGRDGRDGFNGRDGITTVIFRGGPGGEQQNFPTGNARILKSVTVNGKVDVPHATNARVYDKAVTVGTTEVDREFTVTGQVEVPTVESATLSAIEASGTITIPTITGGTLSGATATGTIFYDTYPNATCGPLTASVDIPTSGTFSATPTGIAATGALGTLAGTVTLDIPTGGYLDASCKLVLTTTSVTKSVVFTGAPSVSITSQGKVDGNVTLVSPGSSKSVTVNTPTITLTKSSASSSVSLKVNGGTFSPTTGSTTSAVTVSAAGATVTLTAGTTDVQVSLDGYVAVTEPTGEGTLKDDEVLLDEEYESKRVDITVVQKADQLVYLRPRI
jgi:hypothetical protein